MSFLTAALFAALISYLGGWFLGYWVGNFSLLLFVMSAVMLLYWLAEKFHFKPARDAAGDRVQAEHDARVVQLERQGISPDLRGIDSAKAKVLEQPWWLDWTAGLFPVIVAVFLLRSFFFEPFKIPSGSMVPTLLVGDLILVNKFHFGVRLPVVHKKILANNEPARGDVMVFRYPPDPRFDYIKRVVGIPGDEISYLNKQLSVNGKAVTTTALADYYDEDSLRYAQQFTERLGAVDHRILIDKSRPGFIQTAAAFPHSERCRYSAEGVQCTVPAGHTFVMGDSRDNSLDSRFWGFVPDDHIVGKAILVWLNFSDLGRVGRIQ